MAGKRKELRSADVIVADEAKTKMQLLQSQAWANACARSYCLRYGKDTAGASTLSQEATRHGCASQTTQWGEWLKGKRAVTPVKAGKLAKVETFKGLERVHEIGPWQASPVTGVGAHVPLWEVLRGDRSSILKAWDGVPKEVWRHWLPLEGDLNYPPALLTRVTTYPEDDYDQVEFSWQPKKTVLFREKLPSWSEAGRKALGCFADGETEVPEDIDDTNWVPPLLKEVKKLEAEIRFLGFDFTEEPWAEEFDWLQEVEDYLRAKRRGMWGGIVDEEEFRQKVERIVMYGYDTHNVYHSKWLPDAGIFKVEAGLCELLRQCVEVAAMVFFDDKKEMVSMDCDEDEDFKVQNEKFKRGVSRVSFITPPLVVLAASITLAKMNTGKFCSQMRLREVLPYKVGFEINPKGWNLDEYYWEPMAAELERLGLSMEAFREAARCYGIELYKYGRDDVIEEELFPMPKGWLHGRYERAMELKKK